MKTHPIHNSLTLGNVNYVISILSRNNYICILFVLILLYFPSESNYFSKFLVSFSTLPKFPISTNQKTKNLRYQATNYISALLTSINTLSQYHRASKLFLPHNNSEHFAYILYSNLYFAEISPLSALSSWRPLQAFHHTLATRELAFPQSREPLELFI